MQIIDIINKITVITIGFKKIDKTEIINSKTEEINLIIIIIKTTMKKIIIKIEEEKVIHKIKILIDFKKEIINIKTEKEKIGIKTRILEEIIIIDLIIIIKMEEMDIITTNLEDVH